MYETYAGRLLAVCRRYIREPERAKDLVHDTFLKAWDSLGGFRPRRAGSLGAWLSQIAVHLSVDELRKRKGIFSLEKEDLPEEVPVEAERLREVPVEELIDLIASLPEGYRAVFEVPLEELIDLIASLPEGYRAVFNLFCIDGYSHREIARLLGISEKTSQTQFLKARRKLAALIAAKYGKDEKE